MVPKTNNTRTHTTWQAANKQRWKKNNTKKQDKKWEAKNEKKEQQKKHKLAIWT